jgi:hypothetical protein
MTNDEPQVNQDLALNRELELAVSDDPLDLSDLRLSQEFEEGAPVKKQQKIWAGKPSKQEFIRVRPGAEWTMKAAVLELQEEREIYILTARVQGELTGSELADEVTPVQLYTAITAQGNIFLWPIKLAKLGARENEWHRSAKEAAEMAMPQWVRIAPNMQAKGYDRYTPHTAAAFPEPKWPDDIALSDLLRQAFKDRVITTLAHPVIKRLRGER